MADLVRRRNRIEFLRRRQALPRPRVFRDRSNPLEVLTEGEIRERYRFYPETIHYLCQLTSMERFSGRSHPLPPLLSVLVGLQFFASNSHHIVIADVHGLSRASVSRVIHNFSDNLCLLLDQFVKFPRGEDVRRVQREFYSIAGFPNVVGAVDGTQIKIQGPSDDEEDYVNRKGFHSLNVQMICDATFKFTNVVAKWPGSVHDARIFRESDVGRHFERGELDGVLLGDSGYPCKRYLMTPYQAPQTPAQERFNSALCRSRVVIEQSFGVLKRRFPCLAYGLRVRPETAAKIIIACVILHNIGIDRNDMFSRECGNVQDQPEAEAYEGPGTGNHFREYITRAFFN